MIGGEGKRIVGARDYKVFEEPIGKLLGLQADYDLEEARERLGDRLDYLWRIGDGARQPNASCLVAYRVPR